MKTRAFAALLLLSGCMPLGLYYKAGAPVARADRDLLDCRVIAENKVPPRMVTRVIPGPLLPPRRVCDAAGTCYMIPGRHSPPQIVTEDANEDLRGQVTAQCMGARGYEYVRIPACSPRVAQAAPPGVTEIMPRLGPKACVIRRPGGKWQIVNTE